jgi:Flp pilus assembly protein TadG
MPSERVDHGHRSTEAGSATLELVIATPLLLLLVALVLQLGVLYHAQNVVTAAAQAGLAQGRTETGTADAAKSDALEFIAAAAPDFITKPSAKAELDDDRLTVEVAGDAYAILPGLKLHVAGRASAPRERFDDGG